MTEPLDRRDFAKAAVGLAAAAGATAAAAQPMRERSTMTGVPGLNAAALTAGDWMQQVRAQHAEIDRHFQMLKRTSDGEAGRRDTLLKSLAGVLTGHSIAEEVALYPGIAMTGDTAGSDRLYMEQQHAKVMVAQLDAMPRTGPTFMTQLTALEAAIKEHVAEEENDLYPKLRRTASTAMNAKMTADFRREFTRYTT